MSKIRSKSITSRKPTGVLEIGEQGSTTQFHPGSTVIIPGYATDDRIDEIVAGDISLEGMLTKEEASLKYQALREKGAPSGYVPLSNVGKIPSEFLNVTGLEIVGTYGTENPLPDASGLEDGTAFICNTDGLLGDDGIPQGYVDQYLPGKISYSGDIAMDVGDSYDLIPSTGAVSADQVIETENRAFVHPDHFDDVKEYVDSADQFIKDNYLPLSAGIDYKMTADIYMQQHHIKGLPNEPENSQDAVNQNYVDSAIAAIPGGDGTSDLYVEKTGDTMTGQLNIQSANLQMKGSAGNINATIGYDGHITAKNINVSGKIDVTGGITSHDTVDMSNHKIIQVNDPEGTKDAANKKYVDLAISGIEGAAFDGGTIHNTLTLDSEDRDIDVTSGMAGELKYNGTVKFRWGSGENFCEQTLQMQDNRITSLAYPTSEKDAANKQYVDAIGRPFMFRSTGVPYRQLGTGEFQMTNTDNVSWTNVLADVRYLSFCYEDLDGVTWKMGQAGDYGFPNGFVQLYNLQSGDAKLLGWWLYEENDLNMAFMDYNSLGGVIMPVKGWTATSNTTNLPAGGEFCLHSPYWG